MIYLYPIDETFTVFYVKPNFPSLIEIESLPEGEGILRRAKDGTFYYELFPDLTPVEPVEPIEPEQPVETIDDKLARLEMQLQEQQMQNLILVDINLTVYEELLNMKDQLSMLTGATDNA